MTRLEHLHTNLSLSSSPNTGSRYLRTSIQGQLHRSMAVMLRMRQLNTDIILHPIHKPCHPSIRPFLHHSMRPQYKNVRELLSNNSNPYMEGHPKVLHISLKNHLRGDRSRSPSRCSSKSNSDLSLVCKR